MLSHSRFKAIDLFPAWQCSNMLNIFLKISETLQNCLSKVSLFSVPFFLSENPLNLTEYSSEYVFIAILSDKRSRISDVKYTTAVSSQPHRNGHCQNVESTRWIRQIFTKTCHATRITVLIIGITFREYMIERLVLQYLYNFTLYIRYMCNRCTILCTIIYCI